MKLIAGLGNPGTTYGATRHNIGFIAADALGAHYDIAIQTAKFNAVYGSGRGEGHKLILLKPLTFMNLSGEAVGEAARYFDIAADDIIIIHDELDLPFGTIKLKTQGGSAGHRGVASVARHLHTDRFVRIRIGIGKPEPPLQPADYVLQRFSDAESRLLEGVIEGVTACTKLILAQGVDQAMCAIHAQNRPVPQP